jgi:SNF2 family DNA or RNA helicase
MSKVSEIKTYIKNYSTAQIRQRATSVRIKNLQIEEERITASAYGSEVYSIIIEFKGEAVKKTKCSCPYNFAGVCKHTVATLNEAVYELESYTQPTLFGNELVKPIEKAHPTDYSIRDFTFDQLDDRFILQHSNGIQTNIFRYFDIEHIEENFVQFSLMLSFYQRQRVKIHLQDQLLTLSCNCKPEKKKLCTHQEYALNILKNEDEVRIYFDPNFKTTQLKEFAKRYGMENVPDLENYFEVSFTDSKLKISPKIKGLQAINSSELEKLEALIPQTSFQPKLLNVTAKSTEEKTFLVIGKQPYNEYFYISLLSAKLTKDGNIKNPFLKVEAKQMLLKMEGIEEIKFFSSLTSFEEKNDYFSFKYSPEQITDALKAVVKNPLNYPVYQHNSRISDNITSKSIVPVTFNYQELNVLLKVSQKDAFYDVSPYIVLENNSAAFSGFKLKYDFFLEKNNELIPVLNSKVLLILKFFKSKGNKLMIHESQFSAFRTKILDGLEGKVEIQYTYLKPATKKQLEESGFDQELKKIVYLKDSEDFVTITPVIKYAEREIPARSKMRLYALDSKGLQFEVSRDSALEARFIELIKSSHPHFEEQETEFEFFYLHKQRFLEDGWFLDAFEAWRKEGVEILGFNELKNNHYSPHKISTSVSIASGINWFDTLVDIKFGSEKVKLRDIQKAVYNQAKFVKLGDGKLGMLPDEWLEKYSKFFRSGEIHDNAIRSSKANFTVIDSLFEDEVLPFEVKNELELYKTKFADFNNIDAIVVPKKLKAKLRDYQKHGLNWLHFLDQFNFGGCLADDMGLGKTIQIISFILSLKEKNGKRTHLIILPTSLIFNWQAELDKFAPSLKYHIIYGLNREKDQEKIDNYDIIITTYGTMLSDISFLKKIDFDYIFLDESQAIKNPESKRYKAVRLLQSRNKIVLTGTPIENNTFDIYAQFSFANPGLLGNQTHFKDNYAIPIDKFKETKRAKELQQKLSPFLLRRTKKQVASELPDKTEIVIHCPMGENQRRIYETYRNEFKLFLEKADKNDELTNNNMHILQGLTKLRQICNSPELLNDDAFYGNESSKLDELLAQIEEKVGNHKILVFSQFVSMLELIRKRLDEKEIAYEYLTGQTKDRSARVQSFQEDAEKRVFLISLKAGGTGLNLTEADYVFIVDPWWNPAVENQAIDRCYRIGQKKNVMAIRLICPDTIEDKILQLQAGKKELVEDLIKVDENARKSLAKEDLMALLG